MFCCRFVSLNLTHRLWAGCLVLALWGLASPATHAQTPTGTVVGQVIDGDFGEPLMTAVVKVEGTDQGALTDLDGNYRLPGLRPGLYTLVFSYVGFATTRVTEVAVRANQTTTVDVTLKPEATTDEVVIEVEAKKATELALINLQRASPSLVDGLTRQSIAQAPDASAGQVLRRVSGVTLTAGRFAVVRGLADRYNLAMMDNSPLPSTEADRRTFDFDLIPAGLLDQLQVYKTATPDLPGDVAGGVIRLVTQEVPMGRTLSGSVGLGVHSRTTFQNYVGYNGGATDLFGLDDGTRGLPAGLPPTDTMRASFSAQDRAEWARLYGNDWAPAPGTTQRPDVKLSLTGGNRWNLTGDPKRHTLGLLVSLGYSNQPRTVPSVREDYTIDGLVARNTFTDYEDRVRWGTALNLSYSPQPNHRFGYKALVAVNSEDRTSELDIDIVNNQARRRTTAYWFASNLLTQHELSGQHRWEAWDLDLTWTAALGLLDQNVPNQRAASYQQNLALPGDTLRLMVPSAAGAALGQGSRFYSALEETIGFGRVDLSRPLPLGAVKTELKAGGWWHGRSRTFDARILGFIPATTLLTPFDDSLRLLPLDTVYSAPNLRPGGFGLDDITNPTDQYTGRSLTQAYYLRLDHRYRRWKLVWGVRFSAFTQQLDALDPTNDSVRVDTTYLDPLPSFSLQYQLRENQSLTLAASRTVARPEFREIAPFAFYDVVNNYTRQGNDTLIRTRITNVDLRYAWYPGGGQRLSGSAFFKHFQDPIEENIVPGAGFGNTITSYRNYSGGALLAGLELDALLTFAPLNNLVGWGQWDNFSLALNAAGIFSQLDVSGDLAAFQGFDTSGLRPLQGQSNYVLNLGLRWQDPDLKLGAAFSLNRVGRRIAQVGSDVGFPHVWEHPRTVLDLVLTKQLGTHWELKLSFSDLLAQDQVFYQDMDDDGTYNPTTQQGALDQDRIFLKLTRGQGISLTAKVRF